MTGIETETTRKIVDYSKNLLRDVHRDLPTPEPGRSYLVRGHYEYWHYGCDGFNDKGWGCGYRTLQTICSWILINRNMEQRAPSIRQIQEVLAFLEEDKGPSFIGSRQWIGSVEVCFVLDHLYEVPSKIVHVRHGGELRDHVPIISKHFEEFGSPIMMGGNRDCSSKCVLGIHLSPNNIYLLILDPHFVGQARETKQLHNRYWIKWENLDNFDNQSYYNLCLPQMKFIKREM